jgi:hypothetical protein
MLKFSHVAVRAQRGCLKTETLKKVPGAADTARAKEMLPMTNLSLRDRRHQDAIKQRDRLERQRDEMYSKLVRVVDNLKSVKRAIERYQRTPTPTAAKPTAPANVEPLAPPPASEPLAPVPAPGRFDYQPGVSLAAKIDDALHGDGDLEIPGFLKRAGSIGGKTPADIKAMAEIAAEQASRRTAKARGRIDKMKAKQSGASREMPLTGKAALARIRAG